MRFASRFENARTDPGALTTARAVEVSVAHPEGRGPARLVRAAAREFLARLRRGGELSVVLVGDRAIRALNRRHRGVDRATDVLSFPGDGASLLGDVVISLDTARRESTLRGAPLRDELRLYLAHGLLHLLGHDHDAEAPARRMAAAERRLLGGPGLLDTDRRVAEG